MSKKLKHKKIILGAEATPLPFWDPQTGMTGALAGPASGISFHTLHDDDRAATIYADLMRNLPSRSMLPHLIHELLERDPDHVDWDKHSFLCGYMGPPSIGKSYMVKTLGRLTHPKGCLYLNCKDMDMGTIFVETVFDTSSANREKAAIDAKILQGNAGGKGLSADSINMLRNALGDAFKEEIDAKGDSEGGPLVYSIDWNGIQVKGETLEDQNYEKQILREAISQVCRNEGIVMSNDAGQIGISTRDGIAIRAADPNSADYGRPVLLDEINRAKPGTLQKLYEFFAMLSDPKVDKLQVMGGENRPFTFARKDLPVSYRMNFTGNPATKGMGSAEMDRPLISRFGVELDIRTVPDPALHDYADRISQSLTGVPLTQIYYAARPFFDKNPAKLADVARQYRLSGLSPKDQKNVPAEEMMNIAQAMNVIQLSEQLAEFFSALKNVFNPESQIHKGKTAFSSEYESYLQGLEVDLRLVSKLLEKASTVTPQVLPAEALDFSAAFNTAAAKNASEAVTFDDRLANRGQRLESYLQQWMHQVLVPADLQTRGIRPEECQRVLRMAKIVAAHCGIGELQLKESLRGGIKRIHELYDYDKLQDPEQKLATLSDVILGMSDLPIDGISPDRVKQDIEAAAKSKHALYAVGNDMGFHQAQAQDIDSAASGELVTRDGLLAALSVTELQNKAVGQLWSKAILDPALGVDPSDEAVKIAAGTSGTGYALTTVETAANDNKGIVHIFRAAASDTRKEQLMVVSGALDKRIRALLKSSGVTYVDSDDINAPTLINDIVERSLNGNAAKDQIKAQLSTAFLMRNGAAGSEEELTGKSLGELMAGAHEASAPLRIVKKSLKK